MSWPRTTSSHNWEIWRVKRDLSQHNTTWIAGSVAATADDACRYACTKHWVLEDVLKSDVLYVYAKRGVNISRLHLPTEYLEDKPNARD